MDEKDLKELSKNELIRLFLSQCAIVNKQAEQIKLLEQHVKYLDNKLRKYINENTPSSQKPGWDKKKSPERSGNENKKLGKPNGSNGGTRPSPEITEEKVIRLVEYEEYLGQPINYVERIVGDIPSLPKIKWIKYYLAQYKNPSIGNMITATHPDCPAEGMFGPKIRSLITLLRKQAKVSEEQTIELLNTLLELELAPATIEAELHRTATALYPEYVSIGEAINNSPVRHSDETGQSVNGINWCVYGFSTVQHAYFFAEEKKRAAHIKARLCDDGGHVLVCDGHSIYNWYSVIQRCWSHGIRKEVWLLEEQKTEERILLHDTISGTYKECQELLTKEPPGPHQLWEVLRIRNRMRQILFSRWQDEKCNKVALYMKNGWDSWFTFMFVPGVEPTNNRNERDIRKHVMTRKRSGAFRSEKGIHTHCILLSILETWRKNNNNVFNTLTQRIQQHNQTISWVA